ncbi:MAG: hypothetical protein JWP91_3891 [Fibrobacteres bacterium]|nr:hypothetical protein [Fibrobacterota bacterium]
MSTSILQAARFRPIAAALACLVCGFPNAALSQVSGVPGAAGTAEPDARPVQGEYGKALEGIMSKEGISLGGAFRSQYLHSSLGGPAAISSRRSEESVEFTSVDFDIRARPNTATQGRLMVRMHQDWRNFFSDVGNPINTRWISIDGKVKGMFGYDVGDFKRKYSPLTLYAPEFGVLYEPAVFAGDRREAMDEAFVGAGERLLQGVNLDFDAAVDHGAKGLLKEAHLNVLGSRLRNVETSIQNGNKATAAVERSPVEKFLGSANADFVSPVGASLGGTYLAIFDKQGSYAGTGEADTAAQHTGVVAGRAGFDLATLTGNPDFNLGVSAEYALSKDDTNYYATSTDSVVTRNSIDGSALSARLYGSWKPANSFRVRMNLGYIRNEAGFRNELAQSPVFMGERILNIENDTAKIRTNDVRARNYSTFDAMYEHVFKFAPSEQTNLWQRAPFSKNSYQSSIMTQGEMAAFAASRADTALQLLMPFGPATPNRGGLQSELTLSFLQDRIEAQAVFARLENVTGVMVDSSRAMPNTEFSQMGGGLKVEAGDLMGLALPFTLSGSLVRSTADNAGIAGDSLHAAAKVTSDFLNAGGQFGFWKRFSILGGYQRIVNTVSRPAAETEQVQTHYAGGLDYKVAAGAHLLFSLGRIKVDNPDGAADNDFSQLQTDLFLTVHF